MRIAITWGSATAARACSSVCVRLPMGCGDHRELDRADCRRSRPAPCVLATNSSVQITAAGTPRRSNSIPSCKLHVRAGPSVSDRGDDGVTLPREPVEHGRVGHAAGAGLADHHDVAQLVARRELLAHEVEQAIAR